MGKNDLKLLTADEFKKYTELQRKNLIEKEMQEILFIIYRIAEEGETGAYVNIKYAENIKLLKEKGYKYNNEKYFLSWD